MKRVIQFSKARYFFFAFSALLITAGIVGYFVRGGLNLGVDFKAGVAIQFQIAPASFTLSYTGPDSVEVTMPTGEQAITAPGNFIVTLTTVPAGTKQVFAYKYSEYPTVKALTEELAKIPGMAVQLKGNPDVPSITLIAPANIANVTAAGFTFNTQPSADKQGTVGISEVREVLSGLGNFDMQAVGNPQSQEFIARVEAKNEDPSFQQSTENKLKELLGAKYGADQVLIKKTDFVGPRLAQSLGVQAVWLAVIAVLLILTYMVFRFHPAIYAVAAILAICHDGLVMLGFDAVFHVEVDAATIAAILTILGYSINDTIVIFDRVRENNNLMRGTSLRSILDTSVTQTLSRTFITSGATLLTVVALFALTSGSIKNFSLNMIVGVIEGTYSTFMASFIVLEWSNWSDARRKRKELEKYGIMQQGRRGEGPEAEEEEPEGAPSDAGGRPYPEQPQKPVTSAETSEGQPPEAEGDVQAPGTEGQQPKQGKIVSFPGGQNQAYRHRHKRHKRRRH